MEPLNYNFCGLFLYSNFFHFVCCLFVCLFNIRSIDPQYM
jgi:hypothetical protein